MLHFALVVLEDDYAGSSHRGVVNISKQSFTSSTSHLCGYRRQNKEVSFDSVCCNRISLSRQMEQKNVCANDIPLSSQMVHEKVYRLMIIIIISDRFVVITTAPLGPCQNLF